MAVTLTQLEAKAQELDARTKRNEEDVEAIGGTVLETRNDVRWLKRGMQALLDHHGIVIDPDGGELDGD